MNSSDFEDELDDVLTSIRDMLVSKNKSYGDSALNPLRVFSKADSTEQLFVRIDDKLTRIARGSTFKNENDVMDLVGYLVLYLIKNQSN